MVSVGKKAIINDLIVSCDSNTRDTDKKGFSPVLGVSNQENYELRDLGGKEKKSSEEWGVSVADSETDLTDWGEVQKTHVNQIRTVSEASDPLENINDHGFVSSEKRRKSRIDSKLVNFGITYSNEEEERIESGMSSFSTELSVFAGSRSSSIKSDTPSHTSFTNNDDIEHTLDDVNLDFFCVDHMQLCSEKAIQENHTDCKNVVSALEWAEEQQYERERKTTESQLQKFDTFAGIMVDERKELKRYLTERKEDVTEEALQLMEDLVTHLLKKQKEFTRKFDALHESKMKVISDQIKRCSMIQKETSTCMKQLAEFASGTPEYQQVRKKIHEKCPVYEEILRRDFHAATRMDYEFIPNSRAEYILAKVSFVGDVRVRPKPSKLPGFLSQSRETDFSKRSITNITTSSGISSEDVNNCCFTGCTYVFQGRIILADWNNNCLKMFNKHHILVSRLIFDSNPWDVKMVDNTRVVVTVPGEEKVYIVSYSDRCLEIVTSFPTEGECWGITPIGNKFVVTCDPWGKEPSLKMYTQNGELTAFFQKDAQGEMIFRCAQHITADILNNILYVSNSRQHMLLGVTIKGQVVFRYKHEGLDFPTGVAIDNQGNIYVCGKDSHNVHQVSKNGQILRILLSKKDNLNSPRGICFQADGDKILVTDTAMPECQEFLTAILS